MTHPIRNGLAAGLAAATLLLLVPSGAAADSVKIGFSFGTPHHNRGHSDWRRGYKRPPRHVGYSRSHHRYRRGRRSSFGFVYIHPYPVYSAPPPVVYVPAPAQAAAASPTEGRYCREYQKTATIGGTSQEVYGTACMQPDGSWEIVDQKQVPDYQ